MGFGAAREAVSIIHVEAQRRSLFVDHGALVHNFTVPISSLRSRQRICIAAPRHSHDNYRGVVKCFVNSLARVQRHIYVNCWSISKRFSYPVSSKTRKKLVNRATVKVFRAKIPPTKNASLFDEAKNWSFFDDAFALRSIAFPSIGGVRKNDKINFVDFFSPRLPSLLFILKNHVVITGR